MSAILCACGPKVCTRTLLTFLRSHFLAFSLFHVLTSSLSHFSRSHLLTFSLFHFLVLTSSPLLSHFLTAHGFALSFSLPHFLTSHAHSLTLEFPVVQLRSFSPAENFNIIILEHRHLTSGTK